MIRYHNLTMKKKFKTTVAVLALLGSVFLFARAGDDYFEISKNLDIFASLYREINTNYVDDTKPGELMKTGIEAMLSSLDPYTNYIPESQIEDYRFMTTGQYGGIGALIQKRDDQIVITETYDEFPAQNAGLLIGDRIISIDGKNVVGKSTSEISDFLKGQPKTTVDMEVERGSGDAMKKLNFKLERAEIKIHDVPFYTMINEKVGYIRLAGFTQSASSEFLLAFRELKENKSMDALVIDLRGNGGGLLRESVSIVNLFVDKGTPVVSTRGKLKEWEKDYKAMANPVDVAIPIVVLVDRNSASASEIVAGSIQDLDRGVIIGRTTYGKGLVQQTVDLSYNSKLKVTVAKYYTPSGRCIQKLNYSDRNAEGKAREIPDSLINEFKSIKYGRPLFDGKGIKPDIEIQNETYSNIAFGLVQKNHVFDFATNVRLRIESIGNPKEYEVSDELFGEFKSYIGSQDFAYETNAEALLEELKASTEEEHYYTDIEKEYHELQHKLLEVKSNDLDKHEQEIKNILASEIVLRYHNQKGQLEYSLKQDPYLDSALSVLGNMEKYNAILRGPTSSDE